MRSASGCGRLVEPGCRQEGPRTTSRGEAGPRTRSRAARNASWFAAETSAATAVPESTIVVVFDLETTGLSTRTDRIVEIAALVYRAKGNASLPRPELQEHFTRLVNPGKAISVEASVITGITEEMLATKPKFGDILPEFMNWVDEHKEASDSEHVLFIAHNGKRFDVPVLRHEMKRNGMQMPSFWMFADSLPLMRNMLSSRPGGPERFGLADLVAHFGIPPPEVQHRALEDAKALSQVISALFQNTASVHTKEHMELDQLVAHEFLKHSFLEDGTTTSFALQASSDDMSTFHQYQYSVHDFDTDGKHPESNSTVGQDRHLPSNGRKAEHPPEVLPAGMSETPEDKHSDGTKESRVRTGNVYSTSEEASTSESRDGSCTEEGAIGSSQVSDRAQTSTSTDAESRREHAVFLAMLSLSQEQRERVLRRVYAATAAKNAKAKDKEKSSSLDPELDGVWSAACNSLPLPSARALCKQRGSLLYIRENTAHIQVDGSAPLLKSFQKIEDHLLSSLESSSGRKLSSVVFTCKF